jgi:hypothetical protein
MCSVRHRPMPSAPNSIAAWASAGVSALVRTPIVRYSSAHVMNRAKSPDQLGPRARAARGDLAGRAVDRDRVAAFTVPRHGELPAGVVDAYLARSPRRSTCPSRARRRPRGDVMPPRDVRMPSAACMPPTSSGEVSLRTRMTCSPAAGPLDGLVGAEHDLADARRATRAGPRQHRVIASPRRVDHRQQQLVEVRRPPSPAAAPPARSISLLRPCPGDLHRRRARALAVRVWSM